MLIEAKNSFVMRLSIVSAAGFLMLGAGILLFCMGALPACARSAAKEIERAEFLFFNGDRMGAIEMLEKAKQLEPESADVHMRLLNLYAAEKMKKEAKEECRILMKLKPEDGVSYLMLANLEKEDNNLDAAIKVLNECPDDIKGSADLATLLGFCYLQAGKHEQAKQSFLKALSEENKKQDARVGLAISYWREGQIEQGLKTIDQALADSPNSADVRKLRGDMLTSANRFEEALKELEFSKSKKIKGAQSSIGQLYLKQNKVEQAEAALRKATEENVEDSLSFFLLGQIYEKQGRLEDAIREYKNSAYLEKDKDTASKINARADTLSMLRQQNRPIVLSQPKDPIELFGCSYKELVRLDSINRGSMK